jgi:hypothetical protein
VPDRIYPAEEGQQVGSLPTTERGAEKLLERHTPRTVVRQVCSGCGLDYPCPDVIYASIVRSIATKVVE